MGFVPTFSASVLAPVEFRRTIDIRILVTYVTAGSGHRRAAEAIAEQIQSSIPGVEIQCTDMLEEVSSWLRQGYPLAYQWLVQRLTQLWALGYALLDHPIVYTIAYPLRRRWNLWVSRPFIQRLQQYLPDMVIATHFFPADVVASCKNRGWFRGSLVIIVTDRHPHRIWLSPAADSIVLDTEDALKTCEERGICSTRLFALGIPMSATFAACLSHRQQMQRLFQLDPKRLTVLVTGGGTAIGPFEKVVTHLMKMEQARPGRVQLLVVCGTSEKLHRRIQRLAGKCPMPVRVFGFIDTMPQAMAASDLLVAKAGGLTVTEALGCGLPLIFYHVIPGQERSNAEYVVRNHAGMWARNPKQVCSFLERCLEEPQRLTAMRQAAGKLGHPHAAEAIVLQVVKPLLRKDSSYSS